MVNVPEAGGAHKLFLGIQKKFFHVLSVTEFVIGGESLTLSPDSTPVYKTPRRWRSFIFQNSTVLLNCWNKEETEGKKITFSAGISGLFHHLLPSLVF